jgi:hypothetical protein
VRPWALDPSRRERLYLEPGDVAAFPLDSCGRKRLLLEYRTPRGFDAGLPRSGLLAWLTGDPMSNIRRLAPGANGQLVPAHGVSSVDAAHRGPDGVMFPWRERRELTIGKVRLRAIEEERGRLYFEVQPPRER